MTRSDKGYHKRLYWQKGSIRKCDFSGLSIDDQVQLMHATVKSQWNGPVSYDLKFIKKILQDLESKDIYEEWYTLYTELMLNAGECELICTHYCLPMSSLDEPCISILENTDHISMGQTGFRTWGASFEAITYLRSTGLTQRKKVGELGAGCGLLGLFLKVMGAQKVVMSDVSELIDRLKTNVSMNQKGTSQEGVDVIILDWESFGSLPIEFLDLDFLVAADVIYDPVLLPHLVRVINAFLLLSNKKFCLVSQTIRQESTINLFMQHCKNNSITVELIHERVPGDDDFFSFDEEKSPILIYKLYSHDAFPTHATI